MVLYNIILNRYLTLIIGDKMAGEKYADEFFCHRFFSFQQAIATVRRINHPFIRSDDDMLSLVNSTLMAYNLEYAVTVSPRKFGFQTSFLFCTSINLIFSIFLSS
jgi:hypothetical protein